jgi:UDP-N-acetylglucosamine--N-acetylmuramyl-(pentapeptide) pyrophosphoryl-undecaprenol N-acetylglucosamine transferase
MGFQRSFSPSGMAHNVRAVTKAIKSSIKAKKLLRELKPDVVIGTGGYVSGPVLREAAKLGIKTAIHEQNAFPGITTKALAPDVDRVMLAMPEAEKHMKLKSKPFHVGNPVRKELTEIAREEARLKLGLDNRPLVLSFGGSLGAKPINDAVTGFIASHNNSGKFYHIHAAGKAGFNEMTAEVEKRCGKLSEEVRLREYIDDMNVCMAAADLVICRAGAITLSELCVCGKASILIPSPYVAENHQYHNAMTLKNVNAAYVLEEKDLNEETLIKTVDMLLSDKETVKTMGENAKNHSVSDSNERIYNIIKELYAQK